MIVAIAPTAPIATAAAATTTVAFLVVRVITPIGTVVSVPDGRQSQRLRICNVKLLPFLLFYNSRRLLILA